MTIKKRKLVLLGYNIYGNDVTQIVDFETRTVGSHVSIFHDVYRREAILTISREQSDTKC